MNYKEARVYLEQVSRYGSVLGLDNMRELLGRLGNPQNDLKFIHISGTNGKGSVLAYLSTILSGAGYRTGRYLSPTLFSYREKIQVDGEKINKESLAAHVTAIAEATRDMQEKNAGTPTIFEVETVLAFLYFKEKKCDIVVLETGMGGREDATNLITATQVAKSCRGRRAFSRLMRGRKTMPPPPPKSPLALWNHRLSHSLYDSSHRSRYLIKNPDYRRINQIAPFSLFTPIKTKFLPHCYINRFSHIDSNIKI